MVSPAKKRFKIKRILVGERETAERAVLANGTEHDAFAELPISAEEGDSERQSARPGRNTGLIERTCPLHACWSAVVAFQK